MTAEESRDERSTMLDTACRMWRMVLPRLTRAGPGGPGATSGLSTMRCSSCCAGSASLRRVWCVSSMRVGGRGWREGGGKEGPVRCRFCCAGSASLHRVCGVYCMGEVGQGWGAGGIWCM